MVTVTGTIGVNYESRTA